MTFKVVAKQILSSTWGSIAIAMSLAVWLLATYLTYPKSVIHLPWKFAK
jgi:hypothetical protein